MNSYTYVKDHINLRILQKVQTAIWMQNSELPVMLLYHKEIKLYYYTTTTDCNPLKQIQILSIVFTQISQNILQICLSTLIL